MYTQIKDRDLNTPLFQRILNQQSKSTKKAKDIVKQDENFTLCNHVPDHPESTVAPEAPRCDDHSSISSELDNSYEKIPNILTNILPSESFDFKMESSSPVDTELNCSLDYCKESDENDCVTHNVVDTSPKNTSDCNSDQNEVVSQNSNIIELSEENTTPAQENNSLSITQELLDEFKIQFEDDMPMESCHTDVKESGNCSDKRGVHGSRRKSRRSMDFTPDRPVVLDSVSSGSNGSTPVVTPTSTIFDSATTGQKESDETVQEEKKDKKKRRKRRSFLEMLDIKVKSSPEIELDGLAEMQTLPGTRRSKRLKRQSIEMYRSQLRPPDPVTLSEPNNNSCNKEEVSPTCTRNETTVREDLIESEGKACNHQADNTKELGGGDASLSIPSEEDSEMVLTVNCDDGMQRESVEILVEGNQANVSDQILHCGAGDCEETKPKRRKRTLSAATASQNEENKGNAANQNEENNVNSPLSGQKQGKRKKAKKREDSVEDIYLNRLWRSQMPVMGKPWETIYETAHVNKKGNEEYCSSRRCKRLLNYDDFYTQAKLKRRRQKATKLGYKPLTKRKNELAEQRVMDKIARLESELELIEVEGGDSDRGNSDLMVNGNAVNSLISCSEMQHFTPHQSGTSKSHTNTATVNIPEGQNNDTMNNIPDKTDQT